MRKLWIITAIFGALTAALAAIIFPQFPTDGYAISDGYGGAVYAFEMARTPADLIAVFGPEGDPARPARIAAMDKGNIWDYGFMPAYAGFMALFLWAAFKTTGRKIWVIFAALGLLSAVADGIENAVLLGITSDMANAPFLSVLAVPVWIKFFSIALAVAAAGLYIARHGAVWKVVGWLCALSMMGVLLAFYDASRFGALSGTMIGFGWIVMLGFALRQSLARDRAAA
ncbi:hypothetical protein [Fretibacter rubidus]|uniref:hypothetical protein n=1 Tax=Fretibacter rubidus TaxID=570162 RepID=UPI00352BC0D6